MKSDVKNKTISGLIWQYSERFTAQLISFIVTIILARILIPQEYGVVSIAAIFISILNVFVTSGLGNALVQKIDTDELDFSTVFYFNIAASLLLYLIVFFLAPIFSDFYNTEELTSVVRLMALRIPMAGINTVQHAYVQRKMIFRRFFFATLSGTIISAFVGIFMAYRGFGVYALVMQYLINTAINTIVLCATIGWKPKLQFKLKKLKVLLSFGWKMMAAGLTYSIYSELRSLAIGKKYTSSDLAYYDKGKQFPSLICENINTTIGKVIFPVMSQLQSDTEKLKELTRRTIKVSSYIIFPMLTGLALIAKPLVIILLTEKWSPSVQYLQITCMTYAMTVIISVCNDIINSTGRSDYYLKSEIISMTIGILLLFISMNFGIIYIAYSVVISNFTAMIIKLQLSKKLIHYQMIQFLTDIKIPCILSCVMGSAVYAISCLNINFYFMILLQVSAGLGIYVGSSELIRPETYIYLKNTFKNMIKRKHKILKRNIVIENKKVEMN